MCIEVSSEIIVDRTGRLQLWKVLRSDNEIGIWGETHTGSRTSTSEYKKFHVGKNIALGFMNHHGNFQPAQFHCFFSRKNARQYVKYQRERCEYYRHARRKIIKVYVNSEDVVLIGIDNLSCIPAVSVSKLVIKSLNHQR